MGSGTGFFIRDPRARHHFYVVTNAHVVGNDEQVRVHWYSDLPVLDVEVLGKDEYADVALLRVGPDDFSTGAFDGVSYLNRVGLGIGAVQDIRQGEEVVAMGYPLGEGLSITKGIVSSTCVKREDVCWIKTDAAINPGNSGGPLMNGNGQIIGMNTSVRIDAENTAYALAMSEIVDRFDSLKQGHVQRKPTPTPAYPEAHYEDGSFLALLTWYENGTWWHKTRNGNPCVTRVTQNGNWYSWDDLPFRGVCHYEGEERGKDIVVTIAGTTYKAVSVELDAPP